MGPTMSHSRRIKNEGNATLLPTRKVSYLPLTPLFLALLPLLNLLVVVAPHRNDVEAVVMWTCC